MRWDFFMKNNLTGVETVRDLMVKNDKKRIHIWLYMNPTTKNLNDCQNGRIYTYKFKIKYN